MSAAFILLKMERRIYQTGRLLSEGPDIETRPSYDNLRLCANSGGSRPEGGYKSERFGMTNRKGAMTILAYLRTCPCGIRLAFPVCISDSDYRGNMGISMVQAISGVADETIMSLIGTSRWSRLLAGFFSLLLSSESIKTSKANGKPCRNAHAEQQSAQRDQPGGGSATGQGDRVP